MQRYFVAPTAIQGQTVTITGEDVKHIVRVMRMEVGDAVIVCNGTGQAFRTELTELGDGVVEGRIVEEIARDPEPLVQITLAQGLPKGDKMELIVQKGTEAGISRFLPVDMSRCIVQYDAKKEQKRRERWQKIAKEAAEQSHRNLIPPVSDGVSFKQLVGTFAAYDLVLVPYEMEQTQGLRDALNAAGDEIRRVLVLIGPEGGIAPEEIARAVEAGAVPVTLGPRIVRTETASLLTAACIHYHYGEMGGN